MIDFILLQQIIENNNSFLLTTHVNPDADAIGSEIAFYLILKKLNKKIRIVNHSSTPYNLKFLDTENVIEQYNPETHKNIFTEADIIVALDFNRSDRTVSMRNEFVNSKNRGQMTDKIKELLINQELRNRLVVKGLERLANFSWVRMANQTKEIYQSHPDTPIHRGMDKL